MWFRNIFRRPNKHLSIPNIPDPSGDSINLQLPPSLYRQLDRLQLRASRYLRGRGTGLRPSTRRRTAAEFHEHRQYVPGDDFRFVDWKASARSENIYLKQGEQPQETTIYILLDTSGSMAWGTPPKSYMALSLAAAIGYLALANEDRLQIVPIRNPRSSGQEQDNSVSHLKTFKGKGQFPALLSYLRALPFSGNTDLPQSLREFSQITSRGGIILILSDLLDTPNLSDALSAFPRPTWEVSVLHLLHPEELNPSIVGEFELMDSETGHNTNYNITPQAIAAYHERFHNWCDALELTCIENKASYTLIPTGWSLEKEIIPRLRKLQILEPL